MARALLTVGWVATVGIAATGLLGYAVDGSTHFDLHLLVGLVASLLLLFSHCWIMFYLIGTGKAIKEAAAGHPREKEWVALTRELKGACYGWLMLALGVAMATFILGGGVATRVVPAWIHQLLFFATLLAQVKALREEGTALARNQALMVEVGEATR